MKGHWIAGLIASAIAAGCSAHGVSGTYIARGRDFVQMIEVTQGQDGQLLGSLSSVTLESDGSITHDTTNLAGVADEHTLTLVLKSAIPPIGSVNVPGTIEGGAIVLTARSGQERFSAGRPGDYAAAVQQLQIQAAAIQRQKRLAAEDASAAALNKKLTEYAGAARQLQNEQQLAAFHAFHAKTLERAQHGLEILRKYPKGSFQASQVAVSIAMIRTQLQVFDNDWNGVPGLARSHIREFDSAIANSPCRTTSDLSNCSKQSAAVRAYQEVRPLALRQSDDIETTLKNDDTAMEAIVARADAYPQD